MKKLMLLFFVAVCASSIGYGMEKEKKDLTETHLKNLQLFLDTSKKNELKKVAVYHKTLSFCLKKYNDGGKNSKKLLHQLFAKEFVINPKDMTTQTMVETTLYQTFSSEQDVEFFHDRGSSIDNFLFDYFAELEFNKNVENLKFFLDYMKEKESDDLTDHKKKVLSHIVEKCSLNDNKTFLTQLFNTQRSKQNQAKKLTLARLLQRFSKDIKSQGLRSTEICQTIKNFCHDNNYFSDYVLPKEENKKEENRKLEEEEADELIKLDEEFLKKKNEEENKKLKENETLKKNTELLKQQTELKKKKEEEEKYIKTIRAQKKLVGIGSFFMNFTASSLARYYEVSAKKQALWFLGSNLVLHLINLKKYQNIAKFDEKYKTPLSVSAHAIDAITGTIGYASGNFITNKIIALKKFGDMAFKKYNY